MCEKTFFGLCEGLKDQTLLSNDYKKNGDKIRKLV